MLRTSLSGLFAAAAISFAIPLPSASAQTPLQLELTVSAGKHPRLAVPVSVRVTVPAGLNDAAVRLTDAAGHEVPAQLTPPGLVTAGTNSAGEGATVERELHFILDKLATGGVARFHATLSAAPASAGVPQAFHWTDVPHEHILLTFGSRKVLDYIDLPFDNSTKDLRVQTYKVYHQLYDPQGTRVVTKGVGGQDTHHRGLFYGFSHITYGEGGKQHANTWQCTGDAYESHEGVLASAAGPVIGRQLLAIDWHGEKKKVFAHEERELTVYAVPGGTLLDFASRLRSVAGTVHLDGDPTNPHHAGLHFRADNEVVATHAETYYLRPDAIGAPGKEVSWGSEKPDPRSLNQPWKGMSFVLGGKRYTAAILDRPDNPKESRWSERAYGRFGSFFVADVTPERPLTVRYRFWLQDGETNQDRLAALDADFVEPVAVTVETK